MSMIGRSNQINYSLPVQLSLVQDSIITTTSMKMGCTKEQLICKALAMFVGVQKPFDDALLISDMQQTLLTK